MPTITPTPLTRPLAEVGEEIARVWPAGTFAGSPGAGGIDAHPASPYIRAMRQLDSIDASYGHDSGDDVIRYFLGNANGWRGDDARRLKGELKAALAHFDDQRRRRRR